MKDDDGVKPISALSMYQQRQRQQTFNLLLSSNNDNDNDNNTIIMTELRNHNFGGIIEISGEAGSGKTQLCLSICVSYASTPYYHDSKKTQEDVTTVLQSPSNKTNNTNNNNNNISIENPILPQQITPSKIKNPYKKKSPRKNPHSSPPKENTSVRNIHSRNKKIFLNISNDSYQTIHNNNNSSCSRSHIDLCREDSYHHSIYVSMGEGTTQQQIGQRLHQMITERYPNNDSNGASILLKRIITKKINNEDEVMDFLFHELPNRLLSSKNKVGVLVLDSIAGIYQCQEDAIQNSNYYVQRSTIFFQIATQLKKLSLQFNLHILVVNHVTYSIAYETLIPSLGLSWSNCINTRYLLSRNQKQNTTTTTNTTTTVRSIQVIKSSHLTTKQISYFQIEKSGCRHVSINPNGARGEN